ncbi:hypothetical protein ACFU9X_34880 [Streptomyces atratus]|uniref:hypothetical protein n=1 Tax=Streptomyces atratus TaxID=1893 RepID=UPI0036A40978
MTAATTPVNLTRAAHVGISVSDLDASIAFYKALTGREPVAEGTMSSVPFGKSQGLLTSKLRYATINLDNSLGIDLTQFQEPVGERTNGRGSATGARSSRRSRRRSS